MIKKLLPFLFLFPLASAEAAPIGNPITSVQSSAVESSHILKASSGLLNGFSATSGATAGYVLLIDSASVPADGAVTPKFCYSLPATQTTGASWISYPAPFSSGIVIVFSTSGCFTKAASATAFFSAQIQ
jgi:hypothetical protein